MCFHDGVESDFDVRLHLYDYGRKQEKNWSERKRGILSIFSYKTYLAPHISTPPLFSRGEKVLEAMSIDAS